MADRISHLSLANSCNCATLAFSLQPFSLSLSPDQLFGLLVCQTNLIQTSLQLPAPETCLGWWEWEVQLLSHLNCQVITLCPWEASLWCRVISGKSVRTCGHLVLGLVVYWVCTGPWSLCWTMESVLGHGVCTRPWSLYWAMEPLLDHGVCTGPWSLCWTMESVLGHGVCAGPWSLYWENGAKGYVHGYHCWTYCSVSVLKDLYWIKLLVLKAVLGTACVFGCGGPMSCNHCMHVYINVCVLLFFLLIFHHVDVIG